ncbi:FkbM family methyltransferase [Sulfuricurvum sp. IAE1]|uniref:FkbM family methyltransferase n=1 Tax=Sulfuricurvum sp. IAE1 TaxID=2546102 RepID=UPI0010438442|nr:FkbM family methyltransferase [Sulfuricurvum sp. IAE1]TDA69579.1 FkbM family methyltransferase [Sulfuricurvum sp. IAE1]
MIKKIYQKINYLYKCYILKDKLTLAYDQWVHDNAENTLRLDYPLNRNSIVFDVGGYQGEFAEKIYEKFECTVYVFEPVTKFYEIIQKKFDGNKKIHTFNFGLSDTNTSFEISVADDASSIYKKNDLSEVIRLVNITDFIAQHNIKYVNLLKINIEGGEFELLPEMIRTGFVESIDNIQVQFHNFIADAEAKRQAIRKNLSKTHHLTYDYYFIWENWEKNN